MIGFRVGRLSVFSIAFVGLQLICSATGIANEPERPQQSPAFMPLGVYWAGEYTFRDLPEAERWAKIDEALDGMAKRHINAVWLTHMSAEEGAEFARHAAKRGIYLVACLSELDGSVPQVRTGDHQSAGRTDQRRLGRRPATDRLGFGRRTAHRVHARNGRLRQSLESLPA